MKLKKISLQIILVLSLIVSAVGMTAGAQAATYTTVDDLAAKAKEVQSYLWDEQADLDATIAYVKSLRDNKVNDIQVPQSIVDKLPKGVTKAELVGLLTTVVYPFYQQEGSKFDFSAAVATAQKFDASITVEDVVAFVVEAQDNTLAQVGDIAALKSILTGDYQTVAKTVIGDTLDAKLKVSDALKAQSITKEDISTVANLLLDLQYDLQGHSALGLSALRYQLVNKGSVREDLTVGNAIADLALNEVVTWTNDGAVISKAKVLEYVSDAGNLGERATSTLNYLDGKLIFKAKAQEETVKVTGVLFTDTAIALTKGNTKSLQYAVAPANASNSNVTFATSNAAVATVDAFGEVTAVGNGTATITVTTEDGSFKDEVSVTVTTLVTGVTLNKSTVALKKGASETLTATVAPGDASDKGVTWTSSNTKVATVVAGKVTAVANGTATITVASQADSSKTATATVTVTTSVTGVTLNASKVTIGKNQSYALKATVAPADASNKAVTFASSSTKVATVDATGKVTGKAVGTATITVTTKDGSKKDTVTVTVTAKAAVFVKSVNIAKTSIALKAGQSSTIAATVAPSNATNKNVTWTSSNTKVATVDSKGKVKAVGNGTATITVKTVEGEKTDKITVTVTTAVTSVKLNKTKATIKAKTSVQLTATVAPATASNKAVTWTTSNKAIATVSSTGKVTGVKAGKVTITVTTKDGSKKATATITVTK